MAKQVDIPDELKVLLPEENKVVILIGSKGYEMTPMVEGQLERLTQDMAGLVSVIYNPDRKCPKCGKVYKGAVLEKLEECPEDKMALDDLRKGPIEAILGNDKVPGWIEVIIQVPKEEVKVGMTLPQIKHFAACFWKLNFSDDGLPKETQENFTKLLGMIGVPTGSKAPEKNAETQELTTST